MRLGWFCAASTKEMIRGGQYFLLAFILLRRTCYPFIGLITQKHFSNHFRLRALQQPSVEWGAKQNERFEIVSDVGIYNIREKESLLHLVLDGSLRSPSLRIFQNTNGPVPRSYLPSLFVLQDNAPIKSFIFYDLIEEGLRWYLDSGGRLSKMEFACSPSQCEVLTEMGFVKNNTAVDDLSRRKIRELYLPANFDILQPSAVQLKRFLEKRLSNSEGNSSTLYDIIGRLMHDMGDPRGAIDPYTRALQANPKSAATFRNLGSAYHAVGDTQLAFASYQQAIQLDPKGLSSLKYKIFILNN